MERTGQEASPDATAGKQSLSLPAISMPKGGGAIRSIGEKFGANPVTGTATLSVPIFTSPSRANLSPQLSLAYDSGAGSGPFGVSWHLSVPAITRKTDKGLPRYQDDVDSDVFLLSDAEDLVPAWKLTATGWMKDTFPATLNGTPFTVQRYRPRVEGLFARIERWRNNATGESFWQSVSKDNVTSLYGTSPHSRIADPDDASRVFTWLLDTSYDDKGSVIVYEYKPEDGTNVPPALHEEHRQITANRYLKRIHYGNRTPYYARDGSPLPTDWCFHVVFDYGEHDRANPRTDEDTAWTARPDPFSSYRSGFEIRTYRICQRVLMFHHFPDELDAHPSLVRATHFTYSFEQQPGDALNPIYTFLIAVTQVGYRKNSAGTGYDTAEFPPLVCQYTQVEIDDTIHDVDADSLENLPSGVDGTRYQWVDLDSEGLPGIVTEQANGWFYKRNVSNLPTNGGTVMAHFEPSQLVETTPSLADLRSGTQHLMDLAGDGQLALVQFAPPLAGFYERAEDGAWQPFTPFVSMPDVDWSDPNLKMIDLDGDGHADILITEDEVLTWYPSRAKEGFGPAEFVRKPFDEDKGPALVFADGTQSIYLADLSGDGLTDIVRIRNGEVCYWPNLGYGLFSAKITMDDAPFFDASDLFEQRRIRLADIDGSGTTDILYLGRDKVTCWFNQSGNSWSAPHDIPQFPATDDLDAVSVVDLLGNGTACLVWSSPLPGDALRPMRYIDLMGGQKPHLLIAVKNNLGAETRVQYAASTTYYLQDRAAGHPWLTRLPFPVHVVARVEMYDYVSKTKLVTLYQYHHGYFDGIEREFRGFGMVEQWDTESFSTYAGVGLFTATPEVEGEEFHLPPVHTRTWFHTGAFLGWDTISQHVAEEYYHGDAAAVLLPDSTLPDGLNAQETREAYRALKGHMLRQEIYADDHTPQSSHPYSVTEHTYRVHLVQPLLTNRYAVFYAYECENLAYHYERNPQDPRLSHQLTVEVDAFGHVTKSATVAYPRRMPAYDEQRRTLITYSENDIVNKPDESEWYRLGLPIETRTYELTNVRHARPLYTTDDIVAAVAAASEIAYEAEPNGTAAQKRLIERVRTLYRDNTLRPLPRGQVDSLALPYETYRLAFTLGLFTRVYGNKATSAMLSAEGRYQDLDGDGHWWIPSGHTFFSLDPITPDPAFARSHFYVPQGSVDPFGNVSRLTWDGHNQLLVQSEDALHNVMRAQNDYRVMQPALVTDPNANRQAVAFDALGMVVGTAIMGKAQEPDGRPRGDVLDGFLSDVTEAQIDGFATDPLGTAPDLLGQATTRIVYDLHRFEKHPPQPVFAATLARETHVSDLPAGTRAKVQVSMVYSNGTGREVMRKIQAEPGLAPQRDANGVLRCDSNLQPTNPRWVGTGRTVFDNKGNPIKKYEPFFSSTFAYEDEADLVRCGVTSILRYDPLGRLMRTDVPNGTFSTVKFDAWQQVTADENDTVRQSQWYVQRGSPDPATPEPTDPEARAAWLAAQHANTPTVAHLDTLGRPFLTIAHNRFERNGAVVEESYPTHVELDIEGNQRAITDALGRKVMTYDYDMLSTKIHQVSVDAGERWILNDVAGKPLYAWDSRDHQTRYEYDALHRPTSVFVRTGNGVEKLAERTTYGEAQSDAVVLNLRGKLLQQYDGAGVVTHNPYDFKGNLLGSSRQLLQNYKDEVDWTQSPALENETFMSSTAYDALNRPVTLTTPDASVIRPTYNEANLLEQVHVNLRGAPTVTPFVTNLDYNAKGQRALVEYGNGASTTYEYDPETFRLIRLKTTRASDNGVLQDLHYTYDPVGNITAIRDDAQQTIYFNNQVVTPNASYIYDAIYRLLSATGREHIGQVSQPQTTFDDAPRIHQPLPTDGQAMRNYGETYQYDAVGNMLAVMHTANNGNWTRTYSYDEPNPNPTNNRLTSTTVGSITEPYTYDAHGNMMQMPHLPLMEWDFKDQLHVTQQQAVNNGSGEKTYYVYDAAGQRVRKVTERANGMKRQERIYIGGFEVYRVYDSGGTATLERETLHVMDDQRRVALAETKTIDASAAPNSLPNMAIRYQFDNHLGSACLELDENAAVISYEEYYPYGSTSYQTGRSSAEVSLKRYRYTGKERDEESGLYYHGARYYAPWLGRWVSMDLAGPVDGPNLNAFVHNNPIRWIDPRGHQGVPSRYEPTEKAENFGLTIHFDETTGKVENPKLNLNPLFMPSPANDPEEEWLPLGTTGLKYRKTVEVLDIERPKPERSFWNRGGATLVGGLIALGVGALILASNPVGWALLLAGGFSLTAGIAGTGAGLAHLAASYSGQIPAEADAAISRAESDAMLLSGSATGLVVGATTLGLSGNIQKMRLGAFVGGVAESASTALYSSYRLVSRAADPQAVGNLGRLVHLTEGEAGAAINESDMLVGRRGIYVGPLANAEASGAKVTLRTGLSPRNYTTAVPIPANATGAFARPIPMGPLTGLQGRAGTAFTPYGSLNLSSGIFTTTGANLRQLIFPLVDLGFMSVERLMLYSSPWIQEQ